MKKMKRVHLIEILVISLVAVLIGFFILLSTGKVSDNQQSDNILIFESESATKEYDGKELVNNSYKLVQGQIEEGQEIVPLFTGKQTNIGESDNLFTVCIMKGDKDVSSLYKISYIYGKLNVSKRLITIETESLEKVYDGLPLITKEYKILKGSLINGHNINITNINSPIEVGVYNNRYSCEIVDNNGKNVDTFYELKVIEGFLKIKQKSLTIASNNSTKVYDGKPLRNESYSIIEDNVLEEHKLKVDFLSEITIVGKINNKFNVKIIGKNGEDITENYLINKIEGYLEVKPRNLVIKSADVSREYDGNSISHDNYEIIQGNLLDNEVLNITYTSSLTKVGSIKNDFTYKIEDINDKDVTNCYDVQTIFGQLTITKRNLEINSLSSEKEYDGKSLICHDYKIVNGSLVSTDSINIKYLNSIQKVGSIENNFSVKIKNKNGELVSDCYNILKTSGSLVINPRVVEIKTSTNEKEYDGLEFSDNNYEVIKGSFINDDYINLKFLNSIVDVGKIENDFSYAIYDKNNVEVTNCYKIIKNLGQLNVNPINITIQTATEEKYYDGVELYNEKFEIINGKLLDNDYFSTKIISKITNASSIYNDIYFNVFDENNNDVTYRYNIDKILGKLTIIPRILNISTADASKKYDGSPLIMQEYTISPSDALLENHKITVDMHDSLTEVGEIENTVSSVDIRNENNEVVNLNYDIGYDNGILKVFDNNQTDISKYPLPLDDINKDLYSVSSNYVGKLYMKNNSFSHYTKQGWDNKNSKYRNNNDLLNPLYFISQTLMNKGIKSYNIKINELLPDLDDIHPYFMTTYTNSFNDYNFMTNYSGEYFFDYIPYNYFVDGKLPVTDEFKNIEDQYYEYVKEVYLQIDESTKKSMLSLATLNELNPASESIIKDIAMYIRSSAKYNLMFEPFPLDADMAVYFLETAKEGICQHFATSATMMYRALGIPARYTIGYAPKLNGTEVKVNAKEGHAWVEVYVRGMGWIPVEVTGSDTKSMPFPGEGGGFFRPDYYQKNLSIKPKNLKKKYDGIPLEATNELQGLEDLIYRGYSYEAKVSGSQLNYGRGISKIDYFKLFDDLGRDVTNKFQIKKNNGYLYVYREELMLKTDSKEKIYDGFYFENDKYSLDGKLEEGHYIDKKSIKFIKKFKNVKRELNTCEFKILDSNNKDITNEYFIIKDFGIYEIKPKDLLIKTKSARKKFNMYDDPLTCNEFSVEGLVAQVDEIELICTGIQEGIGYSKNTIKIQRLIDFENNDATNNYNIKFDLGTLEIYV